MRARHVHRVRPEDVGSRVSVRRRDADGEVRDVVGHLRSYADGVLTVEGRRGTESFAEATVLASRVVPEPPEPRGPRRR